MAEDENMALTEEEGGPPVPEDTLKDAADALGFLFGEYFGIDPAMVGQMLYDAGLGMREQAALASNVAGDGDQAQEGTESPSEGETPPEGQEPSTASTAPQEPKPAAGGEAEGGEMGDEDLDYFRQTSDALYEAAGVVRTD